MPGSGSGLDTIRIQQQAVSGSVICKIPVFGSGFSEYGSETLVSNNASCNRSTGTVFWWDWYLFVQCEELCVSGEVKLPQLMEDDNDTEMQPIHTVYR